MTDFIGVVVDLATAPLPLLFIIIAVVMIVVTAHHERKAR